MKSRSGTFQARNIYGCKLTFYVESSCQFDNKQENNNIKM